MTKLNNTLKIKIMDIFNELSKEKKREGGRLRVTSKCSSKASARAKHAHYNHSAVPSVSIGPGLGPSGGSFSSGPGFSAPHCQVTVQ